jgi:hypothetical protein
MQGLKTITFSAGENGIRGYVAGKDLRVSLGDTLFCTRSCGDVSDRWLQF